MKNLKEELINCMFVLKKEGTMELYNLDEDDIFSKKQFNDLSEQDKEEIVKSVDRIMEVVGKHIQGTKRV